MIKSISIHGVATHIRTELDNLQKVNFVFGTNGSGKTTLSRSIAQGAGLTWQGSEAETLVYNIDFIRDNFRLDQKIPGIFTLGKENVQLRTEIDKLNEKLSDVDREIDSLKDSKAQLDERIATLISGFETTCWDIRKEQYEKLCPAQKGTLKDKKKFIQRLLQVTKFDLQQSYDDLAREVELFFGEESAEIQPLIIPDLKKLENVEKDEIWRKKIVGAKDVDIARLIQHLGIDDWVRQGTSFLDEDTDVCPFCQKKTITAEFRKQLELYFDQSYFDSIEKIKQLQNFYKELYEIYIVKFQSLGINHEIVGSDWNTSFEKLASQLNTTVRENLDLVKNKLEEPSRELDLVSTRQNAHDLIQTLESYNSAVSNFNSRVRSRKKTQMEITEKVYQFLRKQLSTVFNQYSHNKSQLETQVKTIQKTLDEKDRQRTELRHQLAEKKSQITNIHHSIDLMNNVLSSAGFKNFHFKSTADNQYVLVRTDGTYVEDTLSEGERNFVCFLYFFYLLQGTQDPEKFASRRVVVIDDPMSSLDTNTMFIISTLSKNLISAAINGMPKELDVQQVIFLTHNTFFYRLITDTHSGYQLSASGTKCNTSYWILRKSNDRSEITRYSRNPITSTYELLWRELYSSSVNLEIKANIMRRIIQIYFNLTGARKDDEKLYAGLSFEDKIICRSLLTWANNFSHIVPDELSAPAAGDEDNYLRIFEKIFKNLGQTAHLKMMQELIEQNKQD